MKTAVITLSGQGAVVARPLAARLGECDVFVHRSVATRGSSERFDSIVALTRRVFSRYRRLVYIVPVGVVVRAIAPCAAHKLTDPAVVVVDVGALGNQPAERSRGRRERTRDGGRQRPVGRVRGDDHH